MATAQEMQDFDDNARRIVCADPESIKAILKKPYQFDERDVATLSLPLTLTGGGGRSSIQLRDKGGRLFWLNSETDPLGIPKFSLRYQANEWRQGGEPRLPPEAAGASYAERIHAEREKLRGVLLKHPFVTAEEFLADSHLMALILRGNNPQGEPYIVTDHGLGKHPLLIGKKFPAQPHHWTCEEFRGFLEQDGRPTHTLDTLEREHAATIRTALKRGLRVPEHVLLSAEGKAAAQEAAKERIGSNQELRTRKLQAQRQECMGVLLASIAADQGHADRRNCSLLLKLAAQEASLPGYVAPKDSLLNRGLGQSVEVSHPELPFRIRITFVTREIRHPGMEAGIGYYPQDRTCSLIVEDARMPFGNVHATLESHSAEYVRMSAQDMLRDGRMTPSQAEALLGYGFMLSCMPRVFVTQNSRNTPAETSPLASPPQDDEGEHAQAADRPRG